uniref:Transmembrane channel-like protein n=1 Tax=Hucho hucho TaxID=62062 RepID=A0A4W5M7Q3_9TELE
MLLSLLCDCRNAMLKVSILAVLCYYWLALVPSNVPCWESYVGQDVYRLVIVDFIFCLLGSFCGEYLYKYSCPYYIILYYYTVENTSISTAVFTILYYITI